MENLDFLDGSDEPEEIVATQAPQEEATPEPETPEEPEQEPQEAAQPRDDQGRFTPKQTQVPLSALEQERARRQALERQLAEMNQPQVPDAYEDPEAFTAFQQQQAQKIAMNVKLDLSEDMARSRHGDDAVEAAREWALAKFAMNPSFHHEVLSHRNPYEHIVQAYKRDQMLAEISPDEFDEYRQWKAAKAASLAPQPAAMAASPQPVQAPPPSLANVPNAGTAKPGQEPVYAGAAFDAIFKG